MLERPSLSSLLLTLTASLASVSTMGLTVEFSTINISKQDGSSEVIYQVVMSEGSGVDMSCVWSWLCWPLTDDTHTGRAQLPSFSSHHPTSHLLPSATVELSSPLPPLCLHTTHSTTNRKHKLPMIEHQLTGFRYINTFCLFNFPIDMK